jgi:hypothetical protein
MLARAILALAPVVAAACVGSIDAETHAGPSRSDERAGSTARPLDPQGSGPRGTTTTGTPTFPCTDPSARPRAPSYALTKTQYRNIIGDLFGADVVNALEGPLSTLPADLFDGVTHSRLTGISTPKIEAYFNLAKSISSLVTSDRARVTAVFGACAAAAVPAVTCVDSYVTDFARRLLRRPLTMDEVAYARQIAAGSGSYLTNMATLLTVHLMSPAFLWRLEINGTPITSYEVASRISFAAADSAPDAMLMAAAAAGQLETRAQVQAHVRRLLQTTNGKIKVRSNILRWSLQDTVADTELDRLPRALTQGVQTSGLTQAMLDESSAYVDYHLYGKASSFKTLLTSRESFASHPGLAAIYGHAPAAPGAPAMFAGRRQGLLMRAPFLASSTARTPIIRRGVNLEKLILCNEIPMPPADITNVRNAPVFTADEMLLHTNREVITRQTDSPACLPCHGIINRAGFSFEGFDPLGRARSTEGIFDDGGRLARSLPVDASSDISLRDGSVRPVQDAYDLVAYIASSDEGSACLVRNAHRFLFERRETEQDSCQLQAVNRLMADPGTSMLDAMAALIAGYAAGDRPN